jgi:dTDP-4-dehydrorhamnose reductase
VKDVVSGLQPDAVINVAAIANIDFAEANRDVARSVNVLGAVNIAAVCALKHVRYVFFSSDAVFSGNEEGYTEDSPKAPVNYYGQTKSDAEDGILAVCENAAVIRISLVLGFTEAGGNSFLSVLEKKFTKGENIICPSEEVRTPIDVATLISCVLELCDNNFRGVIHLGSKNSMNRYEITCCVARLLGFPESLVSKDIFNESGRAPRHKKGVISVALAQKILNTPLHDVEKTIEIAVSLKNESYIV